MNSGQKDKNPKKLMVVENTEMSLLPKKRKERQENHNENC